MDGVIFLIFLVFAILLLGVVLGIIALVKVGLLRRELETLRRRLTRVETARPEVPHAAEPATPAATPPPAAIPAPAPARPVAAPPPMPGAMPAPIPRAVPSAAPRRGSDWKDIEKKLGQRWLIWVGALLILVGLGFFVRQAFEKAGPIARVTAGVGLSLVLLVAGDRFLRRKWRIFGQALTGAGLGAFYISVWAAASIYHIMPQSAAFGLMILCTAAGVALAILHDAIVIAFLAVLGGILTPVMLSTGENRRDILFAYLLLLDVGVLAVAFFRRWLWLDVLAFLGTTALFTGWYDKFYTAPQMCGTLAWLAGFYAVFLVLPFVYHLRRREAAPWPRFVMALANAVFAFTGAWMMLHVDYSVTTGFVALGLTACYVAMAMVCRARVQQDLKQPLGFLALAVGFLVLAAPIQFEADGIILAWSIEAPLVLYFGYRYRYLPLRVMAFALLALVCVYGLAERWPDHDALFVPLLNRRFLAALAPALGAVMFAIVHRSEKEQTSFDRVLKTVAACAAGCLALVVIHGEFAEYFGWLYSGNLIRSEDYSGACFYAALWSAGALAFGLAGLRTRSHITRAVGFGVLVLSIAMLVYLMANPYPDAFRLLLNWRAAVMLAHVAVVFGLAALYFRLDAADPWRIAWKLLSWAGGALLLVVLSVESYNFCWRIVKDGYARAQWTAQMSLSLVWGLYALAVLVVGFWKRLAPVRYTALALFGVTAVKVLFYDTSGLREVYRWITILAVGLLFIVGAYLYYRLEKHLTATVGPKENAS